MKATNVVTRTLTLVLDAEEAQRLHEIATEVFAREDQKPNGNTRARAFAYSLTRATAANIEEYDSGLR